MCSPVWPLGLRFLASPCYESLAYYLIPFVERATKYFVPPSCSFRTSSLGTSKTVCCELSYQVLFSFLLLFHLLFGVSISLHTEMLSYGVPIVVYASPRHGSCLSFLSIFHWPSWPEGGVYMFFLQDWGPISASIGKSGRCPYRDGV